MRLLAAVAHIGEGGRVGVCRCMAGSAACCGHSRYSRRCCAASTANGIVAATAVRHWWVRRGREGPTRGSSRSDTADCAWRVAMGGAGVAAPATGGAFPTAPSIQVCDVCELVRHRTAGVQKWKEGTPLWRIDAGSHVLWCHNVAYVLGARCR